MKMIRKAWAYLWFVPALVFACFFIATLAIACGTDYATYIARRIT